MDSQIPASRGNTKYVPYLVPTLVCALLAISVESTTLAQTLQFYTVTPCRIVDTRSANGPTGGPPLLANTSRDFPIVGFCGIPGTAKAAALNLAIINATAAGNLTVRS